MRKWEDAIPSGLPEKRSQISIFRPPAGQPARPLPLAPRNDAAAAHEHLDGELGAVLCSQPALELHMQENFRQFLDRLRQAGELVDLHQPVDIRHIATLVDQAKTALYFHKVI